MVVDEIKLILVIFLEDYFLEVVVGEDVLFEIKFKEIKFWELFELDDDFVEDVSEFEIMVEFKVDLEK